MLLIIVSKNTFCLGCLLFIFSMQVLDRKYLNAQHLLAYAEHLYNQILQLHQLMQIE
jgi:hypothetical protein